MKKFLNRIVLMILFLILSSNVSAKITTEDVKKAFISENLSVEGMKYCYYSDTGAPVENSEYSAIVGINKKGEAYSVTKDAGSEPIMNWIKGDKYWDNDLDDLGFEASSKYQKNGCLEVMIEHYYILQSDFYLLSSYTEIEKLRETFFYRLAESNESIYYIIKEVENNNSVLECQYSTEVPENQSSSNINNYKLNFSLKYNLQGIVTNKSELNDRIRLSEEVNGAYESVNTGMCPNLFVCNEVGKTYSPGGGLAVSEYNYKLYYGNLPTDLTCKKISCSSADKGTCDPLNEDADICDIYDRIFLSELKKFYIEYEDKNAIDSLNSYNTYKQKISNWCSQTLAHLNYDNPCLRKCLKFPEDIQEIEGENKSQESKCGFSERLIGYILNIVKWIKYIIPVLVIILGIIDFIRAIASDNSDEMKKAQKRFTIRLISAALIFIIPFIIEFVLDKTGFTNYIDGCGIVSELDSK